MTQELGARLGEVTIVKDCMICHREVILLAKKDMKQKLPEKDSILPKVCEKCAKKYLEKGTLLINPDNGKLVVIKDEAFKGLFNENPPKGKIAFTNDTVVNYILKGANVTKNE